MICCATHRPLILYTVCGHKPWRGSSRVLNPRRAHGFSKTCSKDWWSHLPMCYLGNSNIQYRNPKPMRISNNQNSRQSLKNLSLELVSDFRLKPWTQNVWRRIRRIRWSVSFHGCSHDPCCKASKRQAGSFSRYPSRGEHFIRGRRRHICVSLSGL